MEGGTTDVDSHVYLRRSVLSLLPEIRQERAYWKAKALSLAAENERLHAALKSLVSGRRFEDVYEGKFKPGMDTSTLQKAPAEAKGNRKETPGALSKRATERTYAGGALHNVSLVSVAGVETSLDPDYVKFILETRRHQQLVLDANNAIDFIEEEDVEINELSVYDQDEPTRAAKSSD